MNLPVKSLARANYLMTIISGSILAIFLFTYQDFKFQTVFVVAKSIVNILAISFLIIWILAIAEKSGHPLHERKKRFHRFAVTYVTILLYSLATNPFWNLFADKTWFKPTPGQQVITFITGSFLLNLIIFVIHNSVITYEAQSDFEIENAQLKAANAEANTLLLKQQIHPHFLFNALSILKTLIRTDPVAGDVYIVHLANFLRAAVSNTSAKVVSLTDEIKLCDDYISMQKIRFGRALQYSMDIPEEESKTGYVPSFSLQPLLENAIKHNDLTNELPLTIRVYTENEYIVVENNVQRKKHPAPSTGNGLPNLVKRYQLLSGDEVNIEAGDYIFSVRLKILKA